MIKEAGVGPFFYKKEHVNKNFGGISSPLGPHSHNNELPADCVTAD